MGKPLSLHGGFAVLEAVWAVFYEKGVAKLHTDALVAAMIVQDEGQWTPVNGGKPIDAYYLRRISRPSFLTRQP
jgi:hypothetical protein